LDVNGLSLKLFDDVDDECNNPDNDQSWSQSPDDSTKEFRKRRRRGWR